MRVQVAPFRKLRKQKSQAGRGRVTDYIKYDVRQMHVAFTGTVPLTTQQEGGLVGAAGCSLPSPAPDSFHTHDEGACLQAQQATPQPGLQPDAAEAVPERSTEAADETAALRRDSLGNRGQHTIVSLKPGAVQVGSLQALHPCGILLAGN